MQQVELTVLPDNGRAAFDPNGSEALLGEFVALPIPMPKVAMAWTGDDGKPIALWADDARIHPKDFAVVLAGIAQFNADLTSQGIGPAEEPVTYAGLADQQDDQGDDDGHIEDDEDGGEI